MDVIACPAERLPDVLAFWRTAGHGTSISDDLAGVRQLYDRDPAALLLALGAVLDTNAVARDTWSALGYILDAPGPAGSSPYDHVRGWSAGWWR